MELECKFEHYSWIVTSAEITEPLVRIKLIKLKLEQSEERNPADVVMMGFKDTKVEYFPRGLHGFFPHLNSLHIWNCGLKVISRRDLIGLEKLTNLDLQSNHLTSLPDDLFSNMPELKLVFFNDNKLEFLSSELLKPLVKNNVTCVNFSKNKKIDAFYEPASKESVQSLEHLMSIIDEKCKKPKTSQQGNEIISGGLFNKVKGLWGTRRMSVRPSINSERYELVPKFAENVSNGFKDLLKTGQYSDFVIIAGSKKFYVHKMVLGIQSSVFANLFTRDEKGTFANQLTIENFSAYAVEHLIRYLYTGEIEDDDNAIENFAIAATYNVLEMKYIYEEFILRNLNDLNAFDTFLLGHEYKSEEMINQAFFEIRKMFPTGISNDLIDDPKRLKELINAKYQYESLL